MKKFINWILPAVIAGTLFVAVRPTFAQLAQEQANLAQYLVDNDVEVGSEVIKGHSHVYYVFQGERTFITSDGYNNRMPNSKGEYITYVKDMSGAGQIFLYHTLSEQTTQLTHTSTNLDPKVSRNGWVVWEGWVAEVDGWQVFLFDGTSVQQMSSGKLSMNPDIEGEIIIFSQRDISGEWRAVVYSKKENKYIDVATGEKTREPKLKGGKILLSQGKEEFPLTVDDLFILDLVPLATDKPSTVNEEDIIEELVATPSAEIEPVETATESGGKD
jgi:hypothetical protein